MAAHSGGPAAADALHELTDAALRERPLPQPGERADKESRGQVLVIAGSCEIPGAALLAATGALRAGAGKLAVATAASVAIPLALALPEARVIGLEETAAGGLATSGIARVAELAPKLAAVVVGPGMLDEDATAAFVRALLPHLAGCTVVLDAYAMSVVMDGTRLTPNVVLTPHAGEMAHLTGRSKDELVADPLAAARVAARKWNACVAFKGAETAVALPDGTLWLHRGGDAGLATSGSGDTLAGFIGGLAARGVGALDAALWGIRLHALAGEALARRHGPLGYLARELAGEVPNVMHALCGGPGGRAAGGAVRDLGPVAAGDAP